MAVALMCFCTAFFIVRKKKGSVWLKRHRFAATAGVISAITGFLTMLIYYVINDYPNFNSLHAVNGLLAFLFSVGTLTLGHMILKGKKKARAVHRFFGRTGILLVTIAAAFGVMMILFVFGFIFKELNKKKTALSICLLILLVLAPFVEDFWSTDGKAVRAYRNYYGIYKISASRPFSG